MPEQLVITPADAKVLQAALDQIKVLTEAVEAAGINVGRSTVDLTARKKTLPAFVVEFDAIIDGNSKDGSNARYYYGWKKSETTDQGYDKTTAIAGAFSGTATDPDTRALNMAEEKPGKGVDLVALAAIGFAPIPLPDGQTVRMRRTVTKNGKVQFKIIAGGADPAMNGTCTPTEPGGEDIDGGGA